MKANIQERIDQMRNLAAKQGKGRIAKSAGTVRVTSDSLSKSIRNSKEAAIFMAEMDAAFKVAGSKVK